MAYTFTAAEQDQIEAARDLCPDGDLDPTTTGNWVPFYQKLSDLIAAKISGGTITGTDLQGLKNAKLWLDVAIGANGGTGMHSAFIRAYTNRQGELRIGSAFTADEMQKASNGVALNLYRTLSGLKAEPGYSPWQVPEIDQIAGFDASSIGVNLFLGKLPDGDTAITNNAAWSGALGFNLLGGASPFESWRLIQAGDATGSATPNTLDDFKNLLFAVDAYDKALTAGRVQFGFDVAGALGELALRSYEIGEAESLATLQAQLAIGQSSGNWLGAINEIASRTPAIAPVVKLITDVGVNQFLDMLIGARLGKAVYGSTTDANFLANVNAYLGALTPAQLQSYGAELMPTTAAVMVAKAKTDINARAALAALSSVSVEIVATAAQDLDLYDPATGTGELTDLYLKDRAAMLSWKMKYDSGALDENDNPIDYAVLGKAYSSKWDTWKIAGDWNFVDLATQINGSPLSLFIDGKGDSIFTADPDHQIVFGSSAGESLVGQEATDHLYGMSGSDTLTGKGGNDHLEGGAGFDTYVVNAGDGFDTVLDSDGSGVIKFGTLEAKGSAGLDPAKWIHTAGSNVWADQQNGITYSKSVVSGETRLIVKNGDAIVLVKGWAEGELGIVLGAGAVPVSAPPPATSLTLAGDLKPLDHDAEAAGIQEEYDSLDNIIVGDEAEANRADTLYDSSGNDLLQGWGGNDILNAWRGGDDWLEGNAGRDILSGGSGNDLLFADNTVSVAAALAQPEYGGATLDGSFGDFLSGGTGNDSLVGSAQSDALMGGEGDDLILGGAGHDVIFADASYVAQDTAWTFGGLAVMYPATDYVDLGLGNGVGLSPVVGTLDSGVGGEDIVYGGSGGDYVLGGRGNDILYGESGKDVLDGGAGNDIVIGGADDDSINGDLNANPADHGDDYLDLGVGLLQQAARGGGGNDIIIGGDTQDYIEGDDLRTGMAADYHGDDYIDAKGGNDTVWGEGGSDVILGGAGNDTLSGEAGNDIFLGDHTVATVDSYDYTHDGSLLAVITHTPDGSGGLVHSYQIDIGVTPSPAVGGDDIIGASGMGDEYEWRLAA